ncbi:glycoside hydrolase 43 family protein [Parabacteroides sp. FAFU027]|uniref:glycoside hydrolase family 43 protein n=1 Tax=Parabacteroides sp. FAFU027 TaxID=2922715 RepID=UPI001FB01E5B|nr:glycoside hydrolase 43 family protein [Parabacteroides sp. FAFU027]
MVNAQNYVSKVWVSDKGNGNYQNPILYSDYSDPDVIRVEDDYYMTSSSFNSAPGLQILHSKDLVNWKIIGAAVLKQTPEEVFDKPQHGNGVWAPSIRFHNGDFYIYYGDPDYGIYMTKAKNPAGPWDTLTLVKPGKGFIDSCPLWDEDGKAYLVHGFAGSRAGLKSILAVAPLSSDGKKVLAESKIIFDGHATGNETIEGPKFYKRNGYYYILCPAGGVPTGWQLAMRSKSPFGPYESKIVMAQGKSDINGPHQGGWVTTQTGEDWFIHFQEHQPYGRVVHLQPMKWVKDWPVIGVDKDGDGCGDPVATFKKPNVGKTYPVMTPAESDEFDSRDLGLQWQWHANSKPTWAYNATEDGVLRMFSVPVPDGYKNLWNIPNQLLQKLPAEEFTVTTKITIFPSNKFTGERFGMNIMGFDYGTLFVENTEKGLLLSQNECINSDKGTAEKVNESVALKDKTVYLRVKMVKGGVCNYSYSLDNKKFTAIGKTFKAKEGRWIGAKIGLYVTRPKWSNDGGYMDVDWFRFDK